MSKSGREERERKNGPLSLCDGTHGRARMLNGSGLFQPSQQALAVRRDPKSGENFRSPFFHASLSSVKVGRATEDRNSKESREKAASMFRGRNGERGIEWWGKRRQKSVEEEQRVERKVSNGARAKIHVRWRALSPPWNTLERLGTRSMEHTRLRVNEGREEKEVGRMPWRMGASR